MMKYLLPVVATLLSLAAYADEVNPDDRIASNGQMVPIASISIPSGRFF